MLSYANGVLTLSGTARAATQQSTLDPDTTRFRSDPTKGGSEPTRTLSWQVHDANTIVGENTAGDTSTRSEERRVGKECRAGRTRYHKKKKDTIVPEGSMMENEREPVNGDTVESDGCIV